MTYVLETRAVECRYGDRAVVHDFSVVVAEGSLVALLGPSGCGKTTVLRAIAGFHALAGGEIRICGKLVSQPGFSAPPERRRLGMVFQDHALFPHLTVSENVSFGLHTLSVLERRRRARELLEQVGLAELAARYPHELSGGQQQRVALARALAPHPDLLLMDEPFSSLDVELRERLGHEIRDLLKDQRATCVLVTHDQRDAFALADHVGVMSAGRVLQWDTPYNLYHEPNSRFVAGFVGEGVFLPGRLTAPDTVHTEMGPVVGNRAYGWTPGTEVDVLLRPDDIVPDAAGGIPARVVRKVFTGAEILFTLVLPGGRTVLSLFPSRDDHAVGEQVGVRLQADHLVAFLREH